MCENLNQVYGFPFEPLLFSIFTIYARFTSNTKMFESCNILKIFCHHDFSYTRWMIYSSDNFLYGFFKITYQVYMTLIDRSTHCRCSVKKKCSQKSRKFHRKTPVLDSLLEAFRPATLSKKDSNRVVSRIFKNAYFAKHLQMTVSRQTFL